MTAARQSLLSTLGALLRALREPRFYIALVLALALWSLTYQNKRDYDVQIADLASHPYIANFNDIEATTTNPPLKYRWSKADPEIFLPGIGNEPVQLSITTIGSRPNGSPPQIALGVRGQAFNLQTQPNEHTDTFLVQRGNALDGDFDLKMSVPAFSPPGDPRQLGVIIREVAVRPADSGLRPPVVPPLGTLGLLLSGLVGVYLLGMVTTRRVAIALAAVIGCALTAALFIVVARPDLGFLAGQLPSLFGWGLLLGLVGRMLLDSLVRSQARWAGFVAAAGSVAFALAFMLRFGGITYAQFLTSDLFLHIHNTESVLRGDWLFSEPVPDGTLVPYPPAHYVLVSLLTPLLGSSEETLGLLLKWTSSLLDAATCLALAWAGWRLARGPLGGMAALAYAFSPAAFDLFSAGNYTNIFAQGVLNITLLGALIFLNSTAGSTSRLAPAFLAAGFCLTMLSHYGMMLGTLAILGCFLLWTVAAFVRKKALGNAPWLLASGVVALAGSAALYYWHFTAEIWNQWSGVLGKLAGNKPPLNGTTSPQGRIIQSLPRLPGKASDLMDGLILLAGAFGAGLLGRVNSSVRALIGSWLAATLLFALLDEVVGDSVRWYYFGAVPVSLLAGQFLTKLRIRGGWALTLTLLLLASMALYMLVFWVGLIYTRYH